MSLLESARETMVKEIFSLQATEIARLYAVAGQFEKAARLNEQIIRTDHVASDWHGLQAPLLHRKGMTSEAEAEFKKGYDLQASNPLSAEEAMNVRDEKLRREYPMFSHLIPG